MEVGRFEGEGEGDRGNESICGQYFNTITMSFLHADLATRAGISRPFPPTEEAGDSLTSLPQSQAVAVQQRF